MFPMIIFNTDSQVCKDLFYYIYNNLADSEEQNIHIIIYFRKETRII